MPALTAATERPLYLAPWEIRAIVAGRKTEMRRVVTFKGRDGLKHLPHANVETWTNSRGSAKWSGFKVNVQWCGWIDCPFGMPGDRLWAREAAYIAPPNFGDPDLTTHTDAKGRRRVVDYAATMDSESVRCATDYGVRPAPSIAMPRWAARIELEVVTVRVERLQSLASAPWDAPLAEGLTVVEDMPGQTLPCTYGVDWSQTNRTPWTAFQVAWDRATKNPAEKWAADPWVWVVEFRRLPVN